VAEKRDLFGAALASGDFNRDGRDDLAIGAPAENIGEGAGDAGSVNVIYGSADGLTAAGDQIFSQETSGIQVWPRSTTRWDFRSLQATSTATAATISPLESLARISEAARAPAPSTCSMAALRG
jgi:hypothetical protein